MTRIDRGLPNWTSLKLYKSGRTSQINPARRHRGGAQVDSPRRHSSIALSTDYRRWWSGGRSVGELSLVRVTPNGPLRYFS